MCEVTIAMKIDIGVCGSYR